MGPALVPPALPVPEPDLFFRSGSNLIVAPELTSAERGRLVHAVHQGQL